MNLIERCAALAERGNYNVMAATAENGREGFAAEMSMRADGTTTRDARNRLLEEASDVIVECERILAEPMLARSAHAGVAGKALGALAEAAANAAVGLLDRKMADEPMNPAFNAAGTLTEATLLAEAGPVHAHYGHFFKAEMERHPSKLKGVSHEERKKFFADTAKKWHAHKKKHGIATAKDQAKSLSSSKQEIAKKAVA